MTTKDNNMTYPFKFIYAESLPSAWEEAIKNCLTYGLRIKTEYDKPEDPPSRDMSVVIQVNDAFNEPRIHKCMPGGIEDLAIYTLEVVFGIHDDWINPNEGKWSYTYHDRLVNYADVGTEAHHCKFGINQLEQIINVLSEQENSRRAQAILWNPRDDLFNFPGHPPCLQRLWFRLIDDELVMSAHMRSNDAFKASFMNMFAFTELQKIMAHQLSLRLGRWILPTQYNHIVDSFHIYGSYEQEVKNFFETASKRNFTDRCYYTDEVKYIFDEVYETYGYKYEQYY